VKSALLLLAFIAFAVTPFLAGCGEVVDTSLLSVSLTWDAPSKNSVGTTLTDLAGYRIYYSQLSGGVYPFMVTLGPTENLIRIELPEDG
jgi:hypothetical protein